MHKMSNFRYSIAFVVVAFISVAMAQHYQNHRPKLRFRPSADWFAVMQTADESPNYEPDADFDSENRDFYDEDVDVKDEETFSGGDRLTRHLDAPNYQRLCPSKNVTKSLVSDLYDYRPDVFLEVICTYPINKSQRFRQQNPHRERQNKCEVQGFKCIQQTTEVLVSRKLKDSNCWTIHHENTTIKIRSACECMWPEHTYKSIDAHH